MTYFACGTDYYYKDRGGLIQSGGENIIKKAKVEI